MRRRRCVKRRLLDAINFTRQRHCDRLAPAKVRGNSKSGESSRGETFSRKSGEKCRRPFAQDDDDDDDDDEAPFHCLPPWRNTRLFSRSVEAACPLSDLNALENAIHPLLFSSSRKTGGFSRRVEES
ncbi:hypothetical protein KM043_010350 [Ampulex compressa]|nr:hypothetical protein KM043_010350 [Ampulex compressa]